MKKQILFGTAVLLCAMFAGLAQAENLPKVVILATGGTIAGSAETETTAGYQSGQVGVAVWLRAVPELAKIAECTGDQIANVGSQNMNDEIWLALAKRINELAKTDIAGIVITHGTDTMIKTAAALAGIPGKTIILITHSVEEALLLGERLLVMAPRPGRIHKEYRLPFANMGVGADLREIKRHPDYAATREEILGMIWDMEEEIMGRQEVAT